MDRLILVMKYLSNKSKEQMHFNFSYQEAGINSYSIKLSALQKNDFYNAVPLQL